jgi:Na+-transporting methylmalonyl-CoA/oxaloacetate decarboxylase gamma subunit
MSLGDALTITFLGMAVVFSGLLLTALLIVALSRVQRLLEAPTRAERPATRQASTPPSGPEPTPEVLTVITTVLEIERRLNRLGAARREVDHG